ncbi:MAG: hypothetical protein R2867_16090 [Caldilineaceae bacterium]
MSLRSPWHFIWRPKLTPYGAPLGAGMGILLAIGAFIGYIILSAIKHDMQIRAAAA